MALPAGSTTTNSAPHEPSPTPPATSPPPTPTTPTARPPAKPAAPPPTSATPANTPTRRPPSNTSEPGTTIRVRLSSYLRIHLARLVVLRIDTRTLIPWAGPIQRV